MKTKNQITYVAFLLLLVFSFQTLSANDLFKKRQSDQQDILTIKGKVIDAETGDPLVFASISVKETNVAIITNIDGEFTLKITEPLTAENIEVAFLGYNNKIIPLDDLRTNGRTNVISLEPAPIPISEIVVRPLDAEEIMKEAISKIDRNYESIPNLMTAFYRETIRKNRTYVSLGEAVLEIFKAPYTSDVRFDRTRIYKGRKGTDVERMDTVLFKLQGGPITVLELDVAKNTEAILTEEAMEYYKYNMSGIIEIDEKPHYIIDFVQKEDVDIPLFMGSFYVEMDSYAITEVEFGFNLENIESATSIFIRKKPLGMEVTPEIATYRTKYREQDGKWYFAYSRAEVRFKVNWKKKLFNTYYTTMSEIAITDRTDQEVIKFTGKEKIKYSDVFSETVTAFRDSEFWGDYNVIEPDQSIESAIRRLSRKLRFSDR